MRKGDLWYTGTADAIYQNLWLLSRSEAEYVVVLSGDHIYRMDYEAMLQRHKATNASLTIACMEVPVSEASAFGVMATDPSQRIIAFTEKPEKPFPTPENPDSSLASMGVYIFTTEVLMEALEKDAEDPASSHDFGKDIIPKLIDREKVYAHRFGGDEGRVTQDAYWRDVGTLDSFYQANMDLLNPVPPMNLYQKNWAIRTYEPQLPPARTVSSITGNEGIFINSIISSGVVISGGSVQNSILSSNVLVDDGATVADSILFDEVEVGEGCQLINCIVDKHVKIPPNTTIGVNREEDRRRFTISEQGVVVVPESYQF
jgi:glucose-1-phosphate adenylyltransferase